MVFLGTCRGGLKSRNPELVIRKPEKLFTLRSRMLNWDVVSKCFSDFDQLVTGLPLHDKPECIWNCDEKCFQFEPSPVSVPEKDFVSFLAASLFLGRAFLVYM